MIFIIICVSYLLLFRLNTPPGVKVRLTGKIQISTGFLMLNKRNCEVLGGRVQKLVDNWQLKKVSYF